MSAGLVLTIFVAFWSTDDQVAGDLITRLAAPSFDDRVAAYKSLERLGTAALPALRAAVNSSDPRIQKRARDLVASISRQTDTDRLTQPTLIALNFRNRPLGEVVDALNDRHDLRLSLRLQPPPGQAMMGDFLGPNQAKRLNDLKGRPITLESPQPVPFWAAIDRLCQAGRIRFDTIRAWPFGPSPRSFLLIADRTGRGPAADFGPFRVLVTGIVSEFERDFVSGNDKSANQAKPLGAGTLTVSLLALSEPGVKLERNGAPMLLEAVDDQGRSLLPPNRAQADPSRPNHGISVEGVSPLVRIALIAPDQKSKHIRRLKGTIPVFAEARASNPIVIPLQGKSAVGKQISTSDVTLLVDDVSTTNENRPAVRVTVRPTRDGRAPRAGSGPRHAPGASFNRGDALQHLALYDATGKLVNTTLGEQTTGGDSQGLFSRYRLVVAPVVEDGGAVERAGANPTVPAELRYYEFVQREIEIPFDFHDIPMP